MIIQKANLADIEAITTIYNQSIIARGQTADLDTVTTAMRKDWMLNRDEAQYPIFVYKLDDTVVAYGYLSPYRLGRRAFDKTVEVSYYVHNNFQGQGIGKTLLTYLIDTAKKLSYRTLVAILLESNIASIGLLKKYGFAEWGAIKKVAIIDGTALDHLYFGLHISN